MKTTVTTVDNLAAVTALFLQRFTGHFFTVRFIKRTTGEERVMRCRFGVTKALKGGEPAYDREAKALCCVYDIDKQAYRSIPWEGIREIKADGETLVVKPA